MMHSLRAETYNTADPGLFSMKHLVKLIGRTDKISRIITEFTDEAHRAYRNVLPLIECQIFYRLNMHILTCTHINWYENQCHTNLLNKPYYTYRNILPLI